MSPSLSLDNCNCYFFGLLDSDPGKYVVLEVGRVSQTMIDLGANLHPYSNGWRLFVDAGEYSFGHLLKVSMSLGYLKNYLTYVQVSTRNKTLAQISFLVQFFFSNINFDASGSEGCCSSQASLGCVIGCSST